MTKPLPLWTRNREANSNNNPEVESALSAAAGIDLTFGNIENTNRFKHSINYGVLAPSGRMQGMKAHNRVALITCWIARLLALLLFLFWGAFFVEHLWEWFFNKDHVVPPSQVWIGQFLHLVMILGLGTIILRPKLGAVVTIAGTVAFFSWIGYKGFPYIALLNLLPIVFMLASWAVRRDQKAESLVGLEGQ